MRGEHFLNQLKLLSHFEEDLLGLEIKIMNIHENYVHIIKLSLLSKLSYQLQESHSVLHHQMDHAQHW